jgi:hypothetical protein
MIPAPQYAPYLLVPVFAYPRWFASGIALLALVSSVSLLFAPLIKPAHTVFAVAAVTLLWMLALLQRVLYGRLNGHNAETYDAIVDEVMQAWWARHRQHASLVESVMVCAAVESPGQRERFFDPDRKPPIVARGEVGPTLRSSVVFGPDLGKREQHLATLLALRWHDQQASAPLTKPLCCYWLGSDEAWQAFAKQVAICSPLLALPEPWRGHLSLNSIIDRLHDADADTWILCAGCHCAPAIGGGDVAAGEAGLLWMLGRGGGVRFSRGEWLDAVAEPFAAVVKRTLRQAELEAPLPYCMAFAPADSPDQPLGLLSEQQRVLHFDFGALGKLRTISLRIRLLQKWFSLSDPVLAELITAVAAGQTRAGRDSGIHGPLHLFVITNGRVYRDDDGKDGNDSVGAGAVNTQRTEITGRQTVVLPKRSLSKLIRGNIMRILTQRIARPINQWLSAAGLSLMIMVPHVQAQTTPQAAQEIKGLLDFVEHSGCRFVRNGSEYPGAQARAHLEKKLNYLEGKNMVSSAEDFINLGATKSSMTGNAYEVRCPKGVQMASAWLTTELQRQRQLLQ